MKYSCDTGKSSAAVGNQNAANISEDCREGGTELCSQLE